jgi:hypothetical protein
MIAIPGGLTRLATAVRSVEEPLNRRVAAAFDELGLGDLILAEVVASACRGSASRNRA